MEYRRFTRLLTTLAAACASIILVPGVSFGAPTPVVTITSPSASSSYVAPAAITLTANASESGGAIKKVTFYAGTTVIGSDTAAPFTVAWSNVAAGTYVLTAVATDNRETTAQSSPVTVTVTAPAAAPIVSLTSPANGSTFTAAGTMTLTAAASEPGGSIASVVFFATEKDGGLGIVSAPPYTVTWKNLPAGTFSLYAVARDALGRTTTSATVSVTINAAAAPPAGNTPPAVSMSAPANGATYTAPAVVTLTANASDANGTVAKVDFYAGARLVGSSSTKPYGGTWSNVPIGSYALTAVATDNAGATTRSAAVNVTVNGIVAPPPSGAGPLVQASNLVYQGAFRVPCCLHSGGAANAGFEYGGTAIGYDPTHDSLFLTGHDWDQFVGEIQVPAVVNGPVSSLATAMLRRPLTDVTEGRLNSINPTDPNPKKIGGLLPYMGKLFVSAYSYYDGNKTQVLSHFTSGLDLSVRGDVSGPFQVGANGLSNQALSSDAGFVSGYMGLVPPVWQPTFGEPVITGQCCVAIVGRTSYGPAAFGFDPTQLGMQVPLPTRPLEYYPSTNPLANWNATSTQFNGSTVMGGVVFPEGTSSVLFFGRQGVGAFCYGAGTSIQSLDHTLTSDGVTIYCYDPEDSNKGTHAYPYVHQVWAYNAAEMAAVSNGQLQPWNVKPYAVWQLNLPYSRSGAAHVLAAAYDPIGGRIFVSQTLSWADPADGSLPIVHVFKVQVP